MHLYVYQNLPVNAKVRQLHTWIEGSQTTLYSVRNEIATSKNASLVNSICINSFRCTHVITCARFRLHKIWRLAKAMAEMKREHAKFIYTEHIYQTNEVLTLSVMINNLKEVNRYWVERNSP